MMEPAAFAGCLRIVLTRPPSSVHEGNFCVFQRLPTVVRPHANPKARHHAAAVSVHTDPMARNRVLHELRDCR